MPRNLEPLVRKDALQRDASATPLRDTSASMSAENDASMAHTLAASSRTRSIASTPSEANPALTNLHPYTQVLSPSDAESCVCVEDASFPPHERASREKIRYRLKVCGELCLGIFTSAVGDSTAATAESSERAEHDAHPLRHAILLGHIIGTKTTAETVTDEAMALPDSVGASRDGHQEAGRTICVHSLAVLPQYRGCGLSRVLMQAYLQRMESHGVGDRVALIAHGHLIKYYESFGFQNRGPSQCEFGGGGWFDMVKEFKLS